MRSRRNPLIETSSGLLNTNISIGGNQIFYKVKIANMDPSHILDSQNDWRAEIILVAHLGDWKEVGIIQFSHEMGRFEDSDSEMAMTRILDLYASDLNVSAFGTADFQKVKVDGLDWVSLSTAGKELLYLLTLKYCSLIIEEPFFLITETFGELRPNHKIKKYFYHDSGDPNLFLLIDDPSTAIQSLRRIEVVDVFSQLDTQPIVETGFAQFPMRQEVAQSIGTIDGHRIEYIITQSPIFKRSDRYGMLKVFSDAYEDGYTPFGEIHWQIIDDEVQGNLIDCEDLYKQLILEQPKFRSALLCKIEVTESLPKELLGKGLGSMMYRILIQEFWNFFKEPFIFTTDQCTGGSTSSEASRVWQSLALGAQKQTSVNWTIEHKEGTRFKFSSVYDPTYFVRTIIAVDENPELVDITCLSDKGFDSTRFLAKEINPKRRRNRSMVKKKVIKDQFGYKIPERYLTGYKGKRRTARIKEIGDRRKEYRQALKKYGDEDNFPSKLAKSLFRPFKTDDGKSTKRSPYTKEAHKRGFDGGLKQKATAASEYYKGKIPLSILQTVFKRGKAAWSSGGHRPNQTPESWGYARVNSFLVGGKTFWTSDSDQRRKLPEQVRQNIAENAIYNPTLGVIFAR